MWAWSGTAFSYQFSSSTGASPSSIHAIIPLVSHQQTMRQFRKRVGFGHLTVLNISTYLASKSQQFIDEYTAWVLFSDKWWLHYWYSSFLISLMSEGEQDTEQMNKTVAEVRPRFWEICRISICLSCGVLSIVLEKLLFKNTAYQEKLIRKGLCSSSIYQRNQLLEKTKNR